MKRNMTLGVKLLFPILAMVLVGTLASGVLSDRASENALREAALREAGAKGEGLTRIIGMVFSDTHKALEAISLRPSLAALFEPGASKEDVERACADLEVMRSKYPLFQRLGVLSDKGVTLANSTPSAVGTNLGKREYFMEALRGNNYMASVATSSISGKQFTAMSVPLSVNGKIVGVLYGAIDIPPFAERYVDPVRLGNQGYAFVLSREGLIIMHPDKDLLGKGGKDVDPVFTRIFQEKNGSFFYAWRDTRKLCSFFQDPVTGWVVAISGTESELLAPVASLRLQNVIVGLITLALTALLITFLVRAVIRSLNQAVGFAESVAQGDLEQTLELQRNDELGKLGTALNTMVAKLKAMILEAEDHSRLAAEQTEKARQAMADAEKARVQAESAKREGMHQAAGQVDAIMQRLLESCRELQIQVDEAADAATVQQRRANETATAMDQMNSAVIDAAQNAGIAAESSEQAREQAVAGAVIVRDVVAAIEDVSQKTDKLNTNLEQLGQRAQGIGEILGIISDIADQTNLLALNAAIEAARAGEAGRGFAVVADEVRKLAEKTMQATQQVGQAAKAIQHEASASISEMAEASQSVKKSTDLAGNAGDSLQQIVSIVEETAGQVRAIAAAVEEQSVTNQEISRNTDEVRTVAEATAGTMTRSLESLERLLSLTGKMEELVRQMRES